MCNDHHHETVIERKGCLVMAILPAVACGAVIGLVAGCAVIILRHLFFG